jgi:hypothetical protein
MIRDMPQLSAISTNEAINAFTVNSFPPALKAGPVWTSFEHFRKGGTAVLEAIPKHGVATLRSKAGTFRIVRDEDFQRLVGLASEVFRLQNGVKCVVQAAKVFLKHPDQDHAQLLMQSASMIVLSPELPQQSGLASFRLTPEELAEESSDDFDLATAEIPRPQW